MHYERRSQQKHRDHDVIPDHKPSFQQEPTIPRVKQNSEELKILKAAYDGTRASLAPKPVSVLRGPQILWLGSPVQLANFVLSSVDPRPLAGALWEVSTGFGKARSPFISTSLRFSEYRFSQEHQ